MSQQLVLPFRLKDNNTFANFYAGSHQTVLSYLKAFCINQASPYVYLWGQPSVGCTHLLQACCHHLQKQKLQTLYIPLGEKGIRPLILDTLETFSLVCLDNLETIAGDYVWEEAIFHFFNRMQLNKHRLLIAAKKRPWQLGLSLPDLCSRLASSIIFQVKPLSDEEKVHLLKIRAHARGIELTDQVGQFLIRRLPRDFKVLLSVLDTLDKASLETQRKLTVPFVKAIFDL